MTAEPIHQSTPDPARLQELLGRFVNDMGAILQAPLMLIGRELGLFRALASGPLSTSRLAERTATAERYVREWARAQAAAGWISYDPAEDAYFLSPEQAVLFDEEGPASLFGGFEVAAAAGKAGERLRTAFRTGEGIGWHEHDGSLFSGTASFFGGSYRTYLLSSWIPALDGVEAKLEKGARVADVGCGHGVSTLLMAQRFPRSTFFGFDYHEESVEQARRAAAAQGLESRARFLRASAKEFPGDSYDLVTMFDCLHDLGDPVGAAAHALASLTDDGTLLLVEPHAADRVEENFHPVGRLFYSASTLFCTPNSLSQEAGRALGAQAGEAAIREVLIEAGFRRIRRAAETPFNLVIEAKR